MNSPKIWGCRANASGRVPPVLLLALTLQDQKEIYPLVLGGPSLGQQQTPGLGFLNVWLRRTRHDFSNYSITGSSKLFSFALY